MTSSEAETEAVRVAKMTAVDGTAAWLGTSALIQVSQALINVVAERDGLRVSVTALTEASANESIERAEHEALTNVYAVAARLRQFPVPFDDHMALVDAVDQCRSIIEPPIDPFNAVGIDRSEPLL